MCDNTALSFYLWESDKRQESRLAEQSNAVELKKKKHLFVWGLNFFYDLYESI